MVDPSTQRLGLEPLGAESPATGGGGAVEAEWVGASAEGLSAEPRKIPSSDDATGGGDRKVLSEANPDDETPNPPVYKVLSLAKPEACVMFGAFILQVISEMLELIIPLIIATAYDDIVENYDNFDDKEAADKTKQDVGNIMIYVLVLHTISMALDFIRAALIGVSGERVVARLRNRLYTHLLDLDIGFFDNRKTGELVSRLGNDTQLVQGGTTESLSEASIGLIKVGASVALMFTISWKLTVIVFGVGAGMLILCAPFSAWLSKITAAYQDALGQGANTSTEVLGAMRTVRSFGAEAVEKRRYEKHIGDPSKAWWPAPGETTFRLGAIKYVCIAGFATFCFFIGLGALYTCLWYGFILLIDGEVSIGGLTAFQSYIFQVGFGLGQLGGHAAAIFEAMGGAKRIFELLERDAKIRTNDEGMKPDRLEGAVRFEDVKFAYPSRPDTNVLSNFTLDVPAKTTAALVGSSGSGKSTVLQLLSMFYLPINGTILIDGQNIKEFNTSWLRRKISLVQQEPVLFGLTIRENICYGCGGPVSQEVLEDACKQANAHHFVSDFPDGYDTLVGERGLKLSGGQKQRIAIARALITSPRILLLDEATSALDSESERQVQEAIDRLMVGRTTIIVAHRLSTVRDAHQIAVTQGGSVVDVGRHEELMTRCEAYENLVKRQTA